MVGNISEILPETFLISRVDRGIVGPMTHGTGDTVDRRTASDGPSRTPVPELPAWKAFVVQFTRDAHTASATFAGRIEHLSSGRRARFSSAKEVVTLLGELLEGAAAKCDRGS